MKGKSQVKLFIDTSDRNKIIVAVNDKKFEETVKETSSQRLLPFIKKVLERESLKPEDVTKIEVNVGPGSFTGLRVGVAVANTLGFVLGIPVNGELTGVKKIVYK